jgi:hypothetical protein
MLLRAQRCAPARLSLDFRSTRRRLRKRPTGHGLVPGFAADVATLQQPVVSGTGEQQMKWYDLAFPA